MTLSRAAHRPPTCFRHDARSRGASPVLKVPSAPTPRNRYNKSALRGQGKLESPRAPDEHSTAARQPQQSPFWFTLRHSVELLALNSLTRFVVQTAFTI